MKNTEVIPRIVVTPKTTAEDEAAPQTNYAEEKTVLIDPKDHNARKKKRHSDKPASLDDQYTTIKKIGDGGMGIVYLAQDNKLGRNVAVKRLNKTILSHPSFIQRFLQEAKTVASLTHSNIVHVYALDEDDCGPYIVMEYVPGPSERSPESTPPAPFSLVDLVQQDGPLPVSTTLDLMIKISKAIEYAHRCNVIHRDLKPSNILLDESSEPKIVDFGLARKSDPSDKKLTVPGEKMLSLGYGAPEQESDAADSDQRADIYGLGALMYFCLTGQNPRYFRESDLPKELQSTITKALQTNRDKRWTTVKEFIEALQKVQAPSEIEMPTIKTTWRCKWCDTVNPVSIQYCEDCGWDGITPCLECSAKMHVGIQHCGECGADAREYEAASRLLARLNRKMEDKDYAFVAKHAERTASFRPVGSNGRKLIEDIIILREKSEKAIERIKILKEIIPLELSSRNYERAKQFINEYNTITNINEFSTELQQLPALTAKRDLDRSEKLLKKGDWKQSRKLAILVLKTSTIFNTDAEQILRKIRYHRLLGTIRNSIMVILLLLLSYILSAAPVYRYLKDADKEFPSSFYELENILHSTSFIAVPLELYADMCGVKNMYKERELKKSKDTPAGPTTYTQASDQIASLRSNYEMTMLKTDAEYERKTTSWPSEYMAALEELKQRMQADGNYDGWNRVRDEIYYFEVYQEVMSDYQTAQTTPELLALKQKFRDLQKQYVTTRNQTIVIESGKYVQHLKEIQKNMTIEGKMDEASAIDAEIKRIQGSTKITAAAAALAKEKIVSAPTSPTTAN